MRFRIINAVMTALFVIAVVLQGAWDMNTQRIEEAREASGLFIIAVWMAVLVIHGRIARPV